MNLILLITVLLISQSLFTNSYAQNKSNCDCAECHEFDFWVGDWKATWQDSSGIISEGSNSIKKILGDCVIIENFDGNPGIDYTGKSFSVYNQNKKIWQQTWVDSQGGYMLFTGGMQDDKMILSREVETKKGKILQRMIFYNISENSFDWNWEASIDDGMNWIVNWQIYYKRE